MLPCNILLSGMHVHSKQSIVIQLSCLVFGLHYKLLEVIMDGRLEWLQQPCMIT